MVSFRKILRPLRSISRAVEEKTERA